MVADMLLHGVVDAQPFSDLGVDLVPGSTDLPFEKAPQWRQVLVKHLVAATLALRPAHAFLHGEPFKRRSAALATSTFDDTRALNDHARHVFTHGSPRMKNCRMSANVLARAIAEIGGYKDRQCRKCGACGQPDIVSVTDFVNRLG